MVNKPSVSPRQPTRLAVPLWFERGLALLVLVNYLLVLFDLSYIPLRDFWLQGRVQITFKIGPWEKEIPNPPLRILPISVAPAYDWVKGIEPYRSTEAYLALVDQLTAEIDQRALEGNPARPQTEIDTILAQLREQSQQMIAENPFQVANKTGTLERIKNKMRLHVFGTKDASATQAFERFWSKAYLLEKGSRQELKFFDEQIRPLIASNYFRAIGENGQPVDNFPLLDFPFFVIFLVDFLVRTRLISQRYRGVSWWDAMLWRWYDVFLLLPVFRWLRIIPLLIRLDQARLINLAQIRGQAVQGFVAIIAEEMTEVIIIRLISQIQQLIQQGQLRQWLWQEGTRAYIDLNNRNEIVDISRILGTMMVEKVLPSLTPDVETWLVYNLQQACQQIPTYKTLQHWPGMREIQTQVLGQLVNNIYQQLILALQGLLQEDPQAEQLLAQIGTTFNQSLNRELQAAHNLEKIEQLLVEFLEEFKLNYIQKLSETDIERILEETRTLKQAR
ncbi:hypothetical protein [Synechocystis sp. LKSZ1]|uniref:hypothetical protein n=1 Tax=Synechocystis sp. LKSZ1 TaxID=3144951 RepID=UPI00336BAEB3